uniref:Elongation of very long chain fatty acids protein n=1 Tax=Leptobrachium leishanense TaxID=445787 RepID=A0A8C5QGF4_9ANUR
HIVCITLYHVQSNSRLSNHTALCRNICALMTSLVTGLWEGGHNFFCQDTHSGGDADMKIICVLWWYYFSKLIEFMDTFFFILRKNSHQITVLDVYHHASLLNIWWFVMNWVPCGHSYFGATLNSFIHVLMFSYYGLSAIAAMRPYLWWKKYITQCQLTQCVLTMTQTSCAMVWCCAMVWYNTGNCNAPQALPRNSAPRG